MTNSSYTYFKLRYPSALPTHSDEMFQYALDLHSLNKDYVPAPEIRMFFKGLEVVVSLQYQELLELITMFGWGTNTLSWPTFLAPVRLVGTDMYLQTRRGNLPETMPVELSNHFRLGHIMLDEIIGLQPAIAYNMYAKRFPGNHRWIYVQGV